MTQSHPTSQAQPPVFSVIVPVHNRAGLIARCLQSVLGQRFESFEVIVVDDGSVDRTWEVVTSIRDPRLRGLRQEHLSVSVARNNGASRARGRNITFLDSDDEALPGWLGSFARSLSDPHVAVAFCGVQDVSGQQTRLRHPARMNEAFGSQEGLFLPGSYAVRRDAFEAVGGFAPQMRYGEHHELALRLIPFCRARGLGMASVPSPLVRRHRPSDSRERLRSYRRARYESVRYLLETHLDQLSRSPAQLSNHLAVAGVSAVGLGDRSEGRRLLLEAIQVRPSRLRNYGRLLLSFAPGITKRLW